MEEVDISTYSLERLALIKSQFEQEVESLSMHTQSLNEAIARFENAGIALRAIPNTSEAEGTAMLVPMTSSLYVPGKLVNVDRVLVDVGTGYFIDKQRSDALAYVQKKLDAMYGKQQEAAVGLMRKKESLRNITELLQFRVMELQNAAAVKK
jgi:prefoldin alpha subunit